MQSDTFLNDTDSEDEEYSSDSSGDLPENNNIGQFYKFPKSEITDDRFIDQSSKEEYFKVRNELFSKPIVKARLCINSSNYRLTTDFNSSNYVAKFEEVKSVIGITLKRSSVRVPQYNINKTNNKIYYTVGSAEYIATINPGYYFVEELAGAFKAGVTESLSVTWSDNSHKLTCTYFPSNGTIVANKNGMIFKLQHQNGSSSTTISWGKNNITKGAARLLGFHIEEKSSVSHYSDSIPDFSQHHVDLVIPEIPDMACKRSINLNGSGNNIIDRIPLRNPTGEYNYYEPENFSVNYFTPIKLSSLTIQLYADNNELFDSQNTDNTFEFEITILVGTGL